jgi:hypothetical protein
MSKTDLKLLCNLNIIDENLKSENSRPETSTKLRIHEFGFSSMESNTEGGLKKIPLHGMSWDSSYLSMLTFKKSSSDPDL